MSVQYLDASVKGIAQAHGNDPHLCRHIFYKPSQDTLNKPVLLPMTYFT